MFQSSEHLVSPDRHVARVRQKLPGYHNRRFKGKNPEIDRQKAERELVANRRNTLSAVLKARLGELHLQAPDHPLVAALEEIFVWFQPARAQFWLFQETLYMALPGVYVELDLVPEGVRADCFTDADEDLEELYDPREVAEWLRRVTKRREPGL